SNIPDGYPDPGAIAKRSKVQFDVSLSQSRYYIVQSLFDQTITFRHKELQQATKAIHDASAKLGANPSAEAAKLLDEARNLAWSPILDAKQVTDAELVAVCAGNKKDSDISQKLSKIQGDWNRQAGENYSRAVSLAQQAAVK